MEHLLDSHFIHHISSHMHFSIMVVRLVYSFGSSIFGFAKYLKQICLTFLPTMSSTKAFLEVGERRHAMAFARNHTLWVIRERHLRNLFLFEKSFKTSGCKVEQGMSEWCFMNRSISQPPKEKAKSPMETKVKWVSKIFANLFNLR